MMCQMVVRSLLLCSLFIAVFSEPTYAATPKAKGAKSKELPTRWADDAKKAEYDSYLRSLGFEDYSAQITDNLANKTGIGAVSESVLKYNKVRFEIFNQARMVAVELLASLNTERAQMDPKSVERFVDFTARMLSLQPLDPPQEFPPRVVNVPKLKLEESITRYIAEITHKNVSAQTASVISDIMVTLFGAERLEEVSAEVVAAGKIPKKYKESVSKIAKLESLIKEIIKFSYLDSEMGQTRFLGRALAAGLLKYAHDTKTPEIIKSLRRAVRKEGLYLENFVGNTLIVIDEKGTERRITMKNGDFIMERSLGKEAGEITWGARPNPLVYDDAMAKGLLGHWWAPILPVETEEHTLSAAETVRGKLAAAKLSTSGVSHVGIANVLTDPNNITSMVWALDNYPNAEQGGIRISGVLEQFALPGPYMRFAVARYSPKAFYDFAQEQVQKKGYSEVAWMAEKEILDKDGETVKDEKPEMVPLKTRISETDFHKLHGVTRDEADQWYNDVMTRITDFIRHDMLTKEGIGFAYGFSNKLGRAYCTITINFAALQATGIELQRYPDQWNVAVRALGKAGVKSATDLNLKLRVFAPGGYAWQRDLVEYYQDITFPELNSRARLQVTTQPQYVEMNPRVTRSLQLIREFNNALIGDDAKKETDEAFIAEYEEAIWGERQKRSKAKSRNGGRVAGAQHGAGYLTSGCLFMMDRLHVRQSIGSKLNRAVSENE